MLKRLLRSIRERFVTKLILACALTAVCLIMLQAIVATIYVTNYQEKRAIDSSTQILSFAEDYFSDLFDKIKLFNRQLYEDQGVRLQISNYLHSEYSVSKLTHLNRLLSEQLVRRIGSDDGALVEADYYDLESGMHLAFYWNEDAAGYADYTTASLHAALETAATAPAQQRIYVVPTLRERAEDSVLTLYDFLRDPEDLSQISGILFFHYAIDKITEQLSAIGFTDDMEVVLLTQNGELCYDYPHDLSGAAALLEGQPLSPGVYNEGGIRVIQYSSRYQFYIVSSIGQEALYEPVYRMMVFMILCSIAVLALLVVFLFRIDRLTSRRMLALSAGISAIESGRLDVTLPETPNHDELDTFARNLNEMQHRLAVQIEREKENLKRAQKLELMQKDAEYYALQAQINPHFLFNTLEIIRMQALIEHAADTASMVMLFSDVIHQRIDRQPLITFSEELDYCEKYIELFAYRFKNGLDFELKIETGLRRYYVPTYVLQPIIENALLHGLHSDMDDPQLCVEIWHSGGDAIEIDITDNGSGIDPQTLAQMQARMAHGQVAQESIGITNVNNRLRLLFGEEYGICMQSTLGVGTKVMIRIPVIATRKELEAYVQGNDRG